MSIRKIYRKLRRRFSILRGLDLDYRPNIKCPLVRYGSEYGGWTLAAGKLTAESIVYSCGLGRDITFDLGVIEATGATVHGFDPTPKSLDWLNSQSLPNEFVVHAYGISGQDGTERFHPPMNPDYDSFTVAPIDSPGDAIEVPMRRIKTIADELGHDEIDVVKLDIEGSEYDVIADILKSGPVVHQLLVEFHHKMYDIPLESTRNTVEQLFKAGYDLCFVADTGREFSFVLRS